jgi:hypothetical protein
MVVKPKKVSENGREVEYELCKGKGEGGWLGKQISLHTVASYTQSTGVDIYDIKSFTGFLQCT